MIAGARASDAPAAAFAAEPFEALAVVEAPRTRPELSEVRRFLEPLEHPVVLCAGNEPELRGAARYLAEDRVTATWTPEGDDSTWAGAAWRCGVEAAGGRRHVLVAERPLAARLLAGVLGGHDVLSAMPADAGAVHFLERHAGGWRLAMVGITQGGPVPYPGRSAQRRLIVVRHGECTNLAADGTVHSGTDRPLTTRGRWQAMAVARHLDVLRPTVVHSSPSARARETASLLAGGRKVAIHADLAEISLGDLEGRPMAELFAAAPDFFADPAVGLPSGETYLEVAERAVAAVTRILDTDDEHDVIVVAHGGVNRALVFGLGALDARTGLAMRQDWAGVDTLEQVDGAWHARTLNWTPAGVMELGVGRGGAPLALAPDPHMADAS